MFKLSILIILTQQPSNYCSFQVPGGSVQFLMVPLNSHSCVGCFGHDNSKGWTHWPRAQWSVGASVILIKSVPLCIIQILACWQKKSTELESEFDKSYLKYILNFCYIHEVVFVHFNPFTLQQQTLLPRNTTKTHFKIFKVHKIHETFKYSYFYNSNYEDLNITDEDSMFRKLLYN